MFFHLRVFLHSVFFFLVLKLAVTEQVSGFLVEMLFDKFFWLFLIALAFSVAISFSVMKVGKRKAMLPIPVILALSSVGLVAFIDSSSQKFVFILFASAVYYFCLLGIYRLNSYVKDQTARAIISSCATAAAFFFYAVVYGAYLNFTIPLWFVMLSFFTVSFLVSLQYFSLIEGGKKKIVIYSLMMGMAMTEIGWILSFWPFGYLTTGVVMLIFYYVLWDLVSGYFTNTLSKKRVLTNMLLFGALTATVLLSSRWMPVV